MGKVGRPEKLERVHDPLKPIDIPLSARKKLARLKRLLSDRNKRNFTYGDVIETLIPDELEEPCNFQATTT